MSTSKSPFFYTKLISSFSIVRIAIFLEHFYPGSHTYIFLSTCLAVPLAGLLGRATEGIAAYAGDAFGGIINATFGNATEFIICLVALKRDKFKLLRPPLVV